MRNHKDKKYITRGQTDITADPNKIEKKKKIFYLLLEVSRGLAASIVDKDKILI